MARIADRLAALRLGRFRYNSPWTQVALVGFVCFCSVGMFTAMNGLGAGGTTNVILVDIANGVLYGVFALTGLVGGSITNVIGVRLTLCIGTTGYSLYIGSLWAYQRHGTSAFMIVAGAVLGFTAGLLWSAQGQIMLSYPAEKDKGRAFGLFWSIFSLGGVVGASIALGILATSALPAVSTGVYLAFMVIMISSVFTSLLVLPPNSVIRADGTLVELLPSLSAASELRELAKLIRDWRLLALLPLCFASNFFYAYQASVVSALYNARTRALSSFLTNLGAILGANAIGAVLDHTPLKRRGRALTAFALVASLQLLMYASAIAFQVQYALQRPDAARGVAARHWDWSDPRTRGPLLLFLVFFIGDAAYQGLAYYILSSLTNDPFRLARMTGYYKGLQSAGAAISFGMDAVHTPYLTEVLVCFALVLVAFPLALLVVLRIKDSSYEDEEVYRVENVGAAALNAAALPDDHGVKAETKQDLQLGELVKECSDGGLADDTGEAEPEVSGRRPAHEGTSATLPIVT
ncbi:hypothetical protein Q8F55_009192 [Vanrija albida]|uniref:Major facilitator superfamily (MFS) profile domain-containing protein n=1 Tax=Vanrija albida TaxID=181172 RepID=A0ABR3PSX0_9TREE